MVVDYEKNKKGNESSDGSNLGLEWKNLPLFPLY